MAGAELRLALLLAVDQVHHRRIGREEDAAFAGALGDEIDRRGVRQMRLEGAGRLVHQRDAVGEEQHALHPAGAHQEIDQRDHRARLAGAGRHHQQRLALAILLEAPRDRADGALLIGPLDDLAVDRARAPAACGWCGAGSAAPARRACRSRRSGAADSACRPRSSARSRWNRRSPAAGRSAPPGNRRRAWPAAGPARASLRVRLASTRPSGLPSAPHST